MRRRDAGNLYGPPGNRSGQGSALRIVLLVLLAALLAAPALAAAKPQWHDMTKFDGVAFREAGELHDTTDPDSGWPAFPEIMGGGACWADFDNDGYDDLFMANQQFNPFSPLAGS